MRWRWWRSEPIEHRSWPDHGRDERGRLIDGDRVLPPKQALTEPTQYLPTADAPLMTLGQQHRGDGGRRQPGSSRG